jgi:hypothetical protein
MKTRDIAAPPFLSMGATGVVDRCRQLRLQVTEVQFGGKSDWALVGEDGAVV